MIVSTLVRTGFSYKQNLILKARKYIKKDTKFLPCEISGSKKIKCGANKGKGNQANSKLKTKLLPFFWCR